MPLALGMSRRFSFGGPGVGYGQIRKMKGAGRMKLQKTLCILLSALLLLSAAFAGAGAEESEFFLEKEPGCRQLTLYWADPDADYDTCDVWVWFPGKDGSGQLFHPCEYGVKCMVNVPEDVSEVGFIVRRECSEPGGKSWGSAKKDVEEDRFAMMTGADTQVYLLPGDSMQYTSPDGGKTLNPIRVFTLAGIVSPTEIRYFIRPACRLDESQVHVRQRAGSWKSQSCPAGTIT